MIINGREEEGQFTEPRPARGPEKIQRAMLSPHRTRGIRPGATLSREQRLGQGDDRSRPYWAAVACWNLSFHWSPSFTHTELMCW